MNVRKCEKSSANRVAHTQHGRSIRHMCASVVYIIYPARDSARRCALCFKPPCCANGFVADLFNGRHACTVAHVGHARAVSACAVHVSEVCVRAIIETEHVCAAHILASRAKEYDS